jgi:ribosome biogenesis GTPase A
MAALVQGKKSAKGKEEVFVPKFGRVKANLKMGILGLPNVGKSSLFNLLTSQVIRCRLSALYDIVIL